MISLVLSLASLTKDKYKLKLLPLVLKCSQTFTVLPFFSDHQSFPTVMWIQIRVLPEQGYPSCSYPGQKALAAPAACLLTPGVPFKVQAPGHLHLSPTHPLLLFCFGPPHSSLALHISPSLTHNTLSICPPSPLTLSAPQSPKSPPFLNYI